MRNKKTYGLIGLGLFGLGAYLIRRRMIARFLKLGPYRHRVTVRHGIIIPMADGVHTFADLYSPKSERLYPTILIRTPYGRGRSGGAVGRITAFGAHRFAERGYNVLVQDVRGRFDSEGEYIPFTNEAADGRATLEWIEGQSWFNGLLGMWGPSYLGYVQWAIANDSPLYLKALVPSITSSNIPRMSVRDGAITVDVMLRWMVFLERIKHKKFVSGMFDIRYLIPGVQERMLKKAYAHLPLSELDKTALGEEIPYFQDWITHMDQDDPYWQEVDHSQDFSHLNASVHLISGWYDILLRDLLEDYSALRNSGHKPYLTIGPWHHLDIEGIAENLRQGLMWFDAHLKGERRALRSAPVRVYVMGGGDWREMDYWPPPSENVPYYLHAGNGVTNSEKRTLSKVLHNDLSEPSAYIYDPDDPTPSIGGAMMSFNAGAVDNRPLEARPDVLVFTSGVLEQTLEVMGAVHLRLYGGSNLEYVDFFARLCDLYPDGRSINICDGLMRLEPGVGELQPDGSIMIELDMWSTAYRFQEGHSIQLLVSSAFHPRWSRNLGSGDPLISGTSLKTAHQQIFHDRNHPSALILPVVS